MQNASLFESSVGNSARDRNYAQFAVGADPSVIYYRNFLTPENAKRYFNAFLRGAAWRQEAVTMYGKRILVPRLTAWFAEPGLGYTYSNVRNLPMSWTPELLELRTDIEAFLGLRFNSVLLNRYRNENDSVAWHSDDERELGETPTIASISLGASRTFRLRETPDRRPRASLLLEAGSLLVMSGDSQRNYQHSIPKESQPTGERINLTFRVTGRG